jgi:hypothetical protein
MVAGYGSEMTVPVTQETFEILLDGCHQTGALEKALEVLAWMRGVGLKPTSKAYVLLQDTLNVVIIWDSKVFASKKANKGVREKGPSPRALSIDTSADALHTAILPNDLRPAPHDGKRVFYMQDTAARLQVAHPKLVPLLQSMHSDLDVVPLLKDHSACNG